MWRMLVVLDRLDDEQGIWDDFCITNVDLASYAGVALNELVFWSNEKDEVEEVELPAFRVSLKRESGGEAQMAAAGSGYGDGASFLVQDW